MRRSRLLGFLSAAMAVGSTIFDPAAAIAQQGEEAPLLRLTAAQVGSAGIATARAASSASPQATTSAEGGSIQLSGRVTGPAGNSGVLAAVAEGRVVRYRVEPGQTVAQGAALLDFEGAALLTLQRDYLAARATAERAGRALERDRLLAAEGLIAASRLEASAEAQLEAEAGLAAQRESLRLAGWSDAALDRLRTPGDLRAQATLHSPAAGRVMSLGVAAGERVAVGDVLARVGRGDSLLLELEATGGQVARFRRGDAVRIAGCRSAGRVTSISDQLDARTQTFRVRAQLDTAGGCLAPGQFFRASIARSSAAGMAVLRVPSSALVQRQQQYFVFVARDGGFLPTAVEVAALQDGEAWIASGLAEGDEVASKGVSALKGLWLGLGAGEP